MIPENTKYFSALKGFFEGMVHDLRHPVNNLKHVIELLKDDYDNEDRRKLFEKISKKEIENITNFLDSLLSVTKPLKLNLTQTDISNLINNIIKSHNHKAEEKNIVIIKNFEISDNFATILLDRFYIEKVFSNLIRYAFYSMQCGGNLTISIKFNNEQSQNYIHIEVSDTGVGMTEEEINLAFNDFTKSKWIGLGIGLLECKRIITEHKGEISVKSKKGAETIFLIKLPY